MNNDKQKELLGLFKEFLEYADDHFEGWGEWKARKIQTEYTEFLIQHE